MTVRVVAAVLAALALVAASLPAVEHARNSRDAASVDATVEETADAVRALARRSDPGARIATAPRRTLAVSLPTETTLTVEADPPRVVAEDANGARTSRRLSVPIHVCGGREALRGDTTFVYVDTDDGPVVLALRGFIRGDGSRASHACTPRPRPRFHRPGLRL